MKRIHRILATISAIAIFAGINAPPAPSHAADSSVFIPAPQTAYANEFITKSGGQTWFLNEVERLLNIEQKSINTLVSRNDMRNITSFGCSNNVTEIPQAIGELTELKEIFMSNNKLSGIPAEFFTLSKLQVIDMSHNAIVGTIPGGFSVANFPNLKVLLLWDNKLEGSIPDTLYTLTTIENLDLSYNKLEGSFSPAVSGLKKLKVFGASNNKLSGEIPSEFGNCVSLKSLVLWNNELTGGIPDVFGALPGLEVLDLAGNGLTGILPRSLPNTLRKFAARNNHLTGTIPDYSNLTHLDTLDLYSNELSGEIPQTLSTLKNMVKLDLGTNQLRGVVPDIFSGMSALKIVNLSDNKLSGSLPQSLATRQTGGSAVNISKNYLTGETAKAISSNNDNFIDGANSRQNRVYLAEYIQIIENQEQNIYKLFVHRDAKTAVQNAKLKLPSDGYVLELYMTQSETGALMKHYGVSSVTGLVTLRQDADGLYIAVHKVLEMAHPLIFVLRILNNDGSDLSQTVFKVISETPPVTSIALIGASGFSSDPEYDLEPLAAKTKFISGYPDDTMRPDGPLTREEAARMICNIIGEKDTFPYNGEYADVEAGRWSADDIAYLSGLGIFTGYPDGTFRPTKPISRAEFVTLLCRYRGIATSDETPAFNDSTKHWAAPYIAAFSERGIINGYPDGNFMPDKAITRAETVTAVCRLLGREPNRNVLKNNPYKDLREKHWAYWYILEASYEYILTDPGASQGDEDDNHGNV